MKRLIPLLLCFTLLVGCGGTRAGGDDDTVHILATTYPVYLFTTALTDGVENVEVELLVNSQTSCLHDYTLTVNDMKRIEKADIVIQNGLGLEDFMADALAQSHARTITSSDGIDLLELFGSSEPGDDHTAHDHDPHIWMSRENATAMLENIAEGLCELDSAHAQQYNKNLELAFTQLPTEYLAETNLSAPYLITFHDGFQYFAAANGLTLLKAIEEESGSEASAAEIKEIIALIEEYQIPAIFTEKNGSDATARAIARETGCEVYQLDMMMSGEGRGMEEYCRVMEENYMTIAEALK